MRHTFKMISKNSILGLLALASLLLAPSAFAERQSLEGIYAIVNNEVILASDLELFRMRLNKEGMLDPHIIPESKFADLKKDSKLQVEYMIAERILDSEVKRLNLTVTVERVEQQIRDIMRRNNNMSRAEFTAAIQGQGFSMSEYQSFLKTQIERQALKDQEIVSRIRISDEDILAEYLRLFPKAEAGAEYTIAHIYFNPQKGGVEAATQRAQEVLSKLKAGQSFESLAEQHSEDTNFVQGGLLGTFKTGEISPDFEKAVASLNAGETSKLVTSRTGIHILKLVARKVIPDPRFEQEKDKIRSVLENRSFQRQFQNWLEQKREEAFIRINMKS